MNKEKALKILAVKNLEELLPYLQEAANIRKKFVGNTIKTCAIINAKCGACPEDCSFCPQSVHSQSQITTYPMMSIEMIFNAAKDAKKMGVSNFGIVTSGRTISSENEMQILLSAIKRISDELNITPCASLGILNFEQLCRLKDAGMVRYHHNLETSESFYPSICTTRTYDDQIRTIRDAKRAGLFVCSGGIFGMGENDEQRFEFLETIKNEEIDSVPINFLHPQPGTKKGDIIPPNPLTCLKIIILARLMLPKSRIRLCGGRAFNLREMQSWIFSAGCDSVMIGNYLVTSGRTLQDDLQLFSDAGMQVIFDPDVNEK